MWIAELWELGDNNMPTLQVFVSTHQSLFNKLIIIDGSIMDDVFKKLKDINAILMERDD